MWKLACVLAVVACSKDQPAPPPAPAPAPVAAPIVKPAPKPKVPLTAAQLGDVRRLVKTAWKAQHDKRWSDAATGFEAALAINAGDPRLLAELGWSAMNAGDYVKAKRADELAIRAATDPKVRASAYFNLGLVQEKRGDTLGATMSFTTSLALRPNATVQAELEKLGAPASVDASACPAGKSACYCAYSATYSSPTDEDVATGCHASTQTTSPIPGWKVVTVDSGHGTNEVLVDEHDQVVTTIGSSDNRMRHAEDIVLDKSDLEVVAGHKLVWLETSDSDLTQTMDEQDVTTDSYEVTLVTICTIGDSKTPTHCGLRDVPKSTSHSIDHERMLDDGSTKPGKHEDTGTTLEIAIGEDGIATVKLEKGSSADLAADVLGPHPLW